MLVYRSRARLFPLDLLLLGRAGQDMLFFFSACYYILHLNHA